MNDDTSGNLHLPSLSITGFRGIDCLTIPHLGRVTLLAGRNGVGKTTVLDAVRVYAARGKPSVLRSLLRTREELPTVFDADQVVFLDYAALFHGRDAVRGRGISIGSGSDSDALGIDVATPADLSDEQEEMFADLSANLSMEMDVQVFKCTFQNRSRLLPWSLRTGRRPGPIARDHYFRYMRKGWFGEDEWQEIPSKSLGPGLSANRELASLWDDVALTDKEKLPLQALQLILGTDIERVAVVGADDPRRLGREGRRVIVKLRDGTQPVPLRSLGDGVTRMFGIGLALVNSCNGFLLVDEAENGIHHSIQQDFWKMVLRAAHQNNVQVLATTHSQDCWKGFAQAAAEDKDAEGIVIRLERDGEEVRSVEYTEEHLKAAADQDIEVR